MACRYHEKSECPPDCAMRGVFPSRTDDVHGAFRTLRRIMGGYCVLLRRFRAVNSTEDRRVVARALLWCCKCWLLYPTGGPLAAFRQLQNEVNSLAPPEFEPPEPADFNLATELDDIVVPFVLVGPRPRVTRPSIRCRYHKHLDVKCPDDCILRLVFPPNSCEFAFEAIYKRYGGKEILPRHFTGYANLPAHLPSRTAIADSLLWEGGEWNLSPAGGPMLAFARLLRRRELLHRYENLPLQVGANVADAVGANVAGAVGANDADAEAELLHKGGVEDPPQLVQPLQVGANAADAEAELLHKGAGGDPPQVLQGGKVANLQLVVADVPGSQPEEGKIVFRLDRPQPFILQVGDVLLQISFGDGAHVPQAGGESGLQLLMS